jgi:NAD(P)-dependent dehydrogenase (short-subunit alcohol dehydrogenase family)
MGELQGKRTLVTGSGRGLGREIATVFLDQGAQVMLSDVNEDTLAKTAADLGAPSVRCDTSVASDVQAAIDATVSAFGGIDVLVSNAGIVQNYTLLDQTEEDLDRIIAINLKGVFFGIKYGAPAIIGSGGGAIVNMASVAGLNGAPLFGAYCATKHAVVGLTRTAAIELRDHGVRVNCVCPGLADTQMTVQLTAALEAALGVPFAPVVQQVQGRLVNPREVADTVSFLASDRASFINGAAVAVDNGMTARLI